MHAYIRFMSRNPIVWASLLSRNMLPGVVNTHKSTRELLHRILEGAPVPDLEDLSIPVLVSAFDVTRFLIRTGIMLLVFST